MSLLLLNWLMLTEFLKSKKISYKKLENFHKNVQVTKAVQNAEVALKKIEPESHVF